MWITGFLGLWRNSWGLVFLTIEGTEVLHRETRRYSGFSLYLYVNFEQEENNVNTEPNNEFDAQPNSLPLHILESAQRGIEQCNAGLGISLEEFKRRHFQSDRK